MIPGVQKQSLKDIISERVIKKGKDIQENGYEWFFDFRGILLQPDYLEDVIEGLWEEFKEYDNFQIGGMESASIPIIAGLVLHAKKQGKKVNGFYIRKSRKKGGLYRNIEGELNDNPIFLVDDLMNYSDTFIKQVEILKQIGKNIKAVVCIVRFRDKETYDYINSHGIQIRSLFTLSDFSLKPEESKKYLENPYKRELVYAPPKYEYEHVYSKSTPCLMDKFLYLGTDYGVFACVDIESKEVVWKHKIGKALHGKGISSSPLVYDDLIFFGGYDGNIYALDRFYGNVRWVNEAADWIGSSPEIASDKNLLFIGLEYGLVGRHGAILALDCYTGKKKWEYETAAYVHATPLYVKKHSMVFIGGNEGVMRALSADTGSLIWQFETEGGAFYDGTSGFSRGDIKLSAVFDDETNRIAFSSIDGNVYVLNIFDGSLVFKFSTDFNETSFKAGVYGKPLFFNNKIMFGGLDKNIYCYDKFIGKLVWSYPANGRIFSSPVVIGFSMFIGANDGCLYELNTENGSVVSKTHFSERVTNPIIYDEKNNKIYVTTQINQVYKLDINHSVR